MRKSLVIVIVGIIVALFPLLALPPRLEMWILLIIGLLIIAFGCYEYVAQKEKQGSSSSASFEKEDDMIIANRGEEYAFDEPSEHEESEQSEEEYYAENE